ncbi:hypothetical protein QBC43DRAFT_372768 [Cladorrhinum sp. PSN259]|nr:hypothetical protein QBC43DRAFT_372768 [Cladorrhinum sp. PSN259]
MAPGKTPSDAAITKELQRTVAHVYDGPEELTVNLVRQLVTKKLKLDDDYLKEGHWKAKSKTIILDALAEIESKQPGSSQVTAPSPKVPKKKAKPQLKKKRTKKSPSPESEPEASEEDDLSDVEDSPEPPTKKHKAVKASRSKKLVSDDDDEDKDKPTPEPDIAKPTKNRLGAKSARVKSKVVSDDDEGMEDVDATEDKPADLTPEPDVKPTVEQEEESELSEVIDEPPKRKRKPKGKAAVTETKDSSSALSSAVADLKEEETQQDTKAADSDSSLSSVIDDGPAPKRKRKSKDTATAKKSAGARKTKAAAAELSPDEALIKQLQGQLLKCGVRKVWQFEFKKHGAATPKEKIKHLKQMLVDVGMTGRFSEARAKEIKERRELLDDLGAVQEWNETFGLDQRGSRRRGPNSSSKTLAQSDDDDDNEKKNGNDDSDDDEDAPLKIKTRGPAKHRADLAFLDDESESD